MRSWPVAPLASAAALLVCWACSTYTGTDSAADGGGADGTTGSSSGTSGSSGTTPGTDGSPPPGTDAGADAGYVDPGVHCFGKRTCDPSVGSVCCAPFHSDLSETFGYAGNSCSNASQCPELVIECDSLLDCVNATRPNTVCCVKYGLPGPYTGVAAIKCLSTTDCAVPGIDGGPASEILCDRFAPDGGGCPSGTTCQSHPTQSGFDVCR